MATPATVRNVPFCELELGMSASLRRTITRADLDLYVAFSGQSPLVGQGLAGDGRDDDECREYNVLTIGLVSSLLVSKLPGAGTVYLGHDVDFHAPVHVGDTITVTVTVSEKHSDRRLVMFDCEAVNDDGQPVLLGRARVSAPETRRETAREELPAIFQHRPDKFADMIARAERIPPMPTAVVHPCDESSLRALGDAAGRNLIEPIIVAPERKVRNAADGFGVDLRDVEIVDVPHSHAAAERAVELVHEGRAELLMKGSLHTDELLQAVTDKQTGLRTERRISHVFVMDVPSYGELLFLTDAAVNIFPDLAAKADIVQNAIDLHRGLELGTPRVALLSAVETVTPKIPGTIEAAALCKMSDRGQIRGGLLDGPLALDNAISTEAAKTKGIVSEVAGRAQILVAPDLEAGNMLAKNLTFLSGAYAAGIALGARVPIILTSRADSERTRLASCAVTALFAHSRRKSGKAGA